MSPPVLCQPAESTEAGEQTGPPQFATGSSRWTKTLCHSLAFIPSCFHKRAANAPEGGDDSGPEPPARRSQSIPPLPSTVARPSSSLDISLDDLNRDSFTSSHFSPDIEFSHGLQGLVAMDGDLSLSQSFGGLRIANPDDGTSPSPDSALGRARPNPSIVPPSTNQSSYSQSTPRTQPSPSSRKELPSPDSPYEASDPLPPAPTPSPKPSPPISKQPESFTERRKNRQSMPYTYQDQQQAQFPQHPVMIPQYQRQPEFSSQRPSSVYMQGNGMTGAPVTREGSYRLRTETSNSSMSGQAPKRSDSRGAHAALQAGVPVRDNSHSDRSYNSYKAAQVASAGGGAVPPRRTSRGMGVGQIVGSAGSGNTPLSSSPYGMEGGPLASSEEWKDRGAAVGVRQEIDVDGNRVSRYVKKGVKDFIFGQTLGEGSYSTVMAATDRQTLKEYAIKVLDKRHIIKEKKVKYVNIEKDTLNRLTDHPGVVRLYYTFQDERSLYFVLDLAAGGELLGVLKRMTTFDEECTRFYGAQILDTVAYMHNRGVIHRDLKPENVLLDDHMHVKITDFGTAKILQRPEDSSGSIPLGSEPSSGAEDNRANSFVGTAEYVSPELLTDKSACKASDLWAFGCIIYQLLAGRPPFKAGNEYQTFQKIVALEYEFPKGFPEVARDLVERLLVLDPALRLSIEHIKNHQFFDGIVWGRGLWKQKAPRLKPYSPPTNDPIRLNGSNDDNFPSNINPAHSTTAAHMPPNSRPAPRVITELPPPSQLDIEWSPVLTRNNERILKLGNLLVTSAPAPHSPSVKNGQASSGRFSKFFGGGDTTKKRERLVMITSSGRILIAAAGGDEKKTKMEISIVAPGVSWRTTQDGRGVTSWVVDTVRFQSILLGIITKHYCQRDKHFVFEDPRQSTSEPETSGLSVQEWVDMLDRAREITISQSVSNSYSGDDTFKDLSSGMSSHANTLDRSSEFNAEAHGNNGREGRKTLMKHHDVDSESLKGKKRFSKRQSKSGLAAVF
jgi:3-phosphoinositide dependent protein kinase-1